MKAFAIALLSVSLIGGAYSAAIAQSGTSPSTEAKPAAPTTPSDPAPAKPADAPSAKPEAPAAGDSVSGSGSTESTTKSDDNVSALPRSSTVERTTLFGLSPTAAVLIAAALLLVVILAIVAMTRTNDTYIDTNRRV